VELCNKGNWKLFSLIEIERRGESEYWITHWERGVSKYSWIHFEKSSFYFLWWRVIIKDKIRTRMFLICCSHVWNCYYLYFVLWISKIQEVFPCLFGGCKDKFLRIWNLWIVFVLMLGSSGCFREYLHSCLSILSLQEKKGNAYLLV